MLFKTYCNKYINHGLPCTIKILTYVLFYCFVFASCGKKEYHNNQDKSYYTIQNLKMAKNNSVPEQMKYYLDHSIFQDGLRIASYNTMLLSLNLFPNYGQTARANLISGYGFFDFQDVVVLQEVFDSKSYDFLLGNFSKKFPFHTPVIGKTKSGWDSTQGAWSSLKPENGGVIIISKWPIVEKIQHIYNESCGSDSLSLKGFAYAKIDFNGTYYHIIGTHLQSEDEYCKIIGFDSKGVKTRKLQLEEINNFIKNKNIPKNEFVIIAGDMNIDKQNKFEYKRMLEILDVHEPTF